MNDIPQKQGSGLEKQAISKAISLQQGFLLLDSRGAVVTERYVCVW